MNVTIQNQRSDFELGLPIFFTSGTKCRRGPSSEDTVRLSLDFSNCLKRSKGALVCELQQRSRFTIQDDMVLAPTGSIRPTGIYLLVVWRFTKQKMPRIYMSLVECDKECTLNRARLKKIYRKYRHLLVKHYDLTEATWLVNEKTTMTVSLNAIDYMWLGLMITISNGIEDDYAVKPMRLNLKA
jgi:hypothetical protein